MLVILSNIASVNPEPFSAMLEQPSSPELGSRDGEGVAFPLGQLDEFALRKVLRRHAVHPITEHINQFGTKERWVTGRTESVRNESSWVEKTHIGPPR